MSRNNRYLLQLNTAGNSYSIINPSNQTVTIPGTSGNATLDEGISFGDISGISSSIIFYGQGIPYPDKAPNTPFASSATIALQNTSGDQMTVVFSPATGVVTYYYKPQTLPLGMDMYQSIPLSETINQNNIKTIELLLADLRSDPNLSNKYGILPIFKVIDNKGVKIVKLFLDNPKTDPNVKTDAGTISLEYAELYRNNEILKLIKEAIQKQ